MPSFRSRVRLADEVAAIIRDRIYQGEYAPGRLLRQEQLAGELDVSRTPLREALRVLEQDGLVTSEPNRGVRVAEADSQRLVRAYRMREMIDGLAARLAAEHCPKGLNDTLLSVIDRQEAALAPWRPAVYTAANVDFHTCLVEAADNEFLGAQLSLIPMTAQVFTPIPQMPRSRAESSIREHRCVTEAIRDGDGGLAEELARDHIRRTIARL